MMFHFNARWRFKLPELSPPYLTGSVVAASAMPRPMLESRPLSQYRNLSRRFFDPQLYLAGLPRDRCRGAIVNLATNPWFAADGFPQYEKTRQPSVKAYLKKYRKKMVKGWRGQVFQEPAEIRAAVEAAVTLQLRLHCESIILPSPLTKTLFGGYEEESAWLDAGLAVCRDLRVGRPIFATVALSDVIMRGEDPRANRVLHMVTDQVSARDVSGVYLVVEQASEEGYFCGDEHTCLSVLMLVDDLVRGAGKRVIVNYMGHFGAAAVAAGADAWVSGYYLGQRRLRLAQFEVTEGRSYPRYHSLQLAGDVGVKEDLEMLVRRGYGARLFTKTEAAEALHSALRLKLPIVPKWAYSMTNVDRAFAHYLTCGALQAAKLTSLGQKGRVSKVSHWLSRAAELAEELEEVTSSYTDTTHQGAWNRSFLTWRQVAGL